MCSTNAAPSFGPVISGVATQKLGWRWIFWFLAIMAGIYLAVISLFLPETQRTLVGNGSIPARGLHRSLFSLVIKDRTPIGCSEVRKKQYRIPNPFTCVLTLFDKGNLTVILIGSTTYMVKMTLQTSLATECTEIYDLTYLQAGLTYLPSGIGGALASFMTGTNDTGSLTI